MKKKELKFNLHNKFGIWSSKFKFYYFSRLTLTKLSFSPSFISVCKMTLTLLKLHYIYCAFNSKIYFKMIIFIRQEKERLK